MGTPTNSDLLRTHLRGYFFFFFSLWPKQFAIVISQKESSLKCNELGVDYDINILSTLTYLPIWTDGVVGVFPVDDNFVLELTTSEN